MPIIHAGRLRHHAAGLAELFFVVAILRHRHRNTVSGKQHGGVPTVVAQFTDRLSNAGDHRVDESGMVETHADLLDPRRPRTDLGLGPHEVLAVLSTSAKATEHAGEKRQRPLPAVAFHLFESFGEHRVPIPVAPVDRQIDALRLKLGFDCRQQGPVLIVDR